MMEDYTYTLHQANMSDVSDHVTEVRLLIHLEDRLQSLGKELRDVTLPSPDVTNRTEVVAIDSRLRLLQSNHTSTLPRTLREEMIYDEASQAQQALTQMALLNNGQREDNNSM